MAHNNEWQKERNQEILRLKESGVSLEIIAGKYGITKQRIGEICRANSPEAIRKKEEYYLYQKNGGSITSKTSMVAGTRDRVRELVRIRDKHTCQCCKKVWVKGTRRFDVHHLEEGMEGKSADKGISKYDRNNMDKLITYCHRCHFNIDSLRQRMGVFVP